MGWRSLASTCSPGSTASSRSGTAPSTASAPTLMDKLDLAYFWTLPCSGALCFVVGFLFGLPALRLQGLYLALGTFAMAAALPQILKFSPLEPLTGGVQGIVL